LTGVEALGNICGMRDVCSGAAAVVIVVTSFGCTQDYPSFSGATGAPDANGGGLAGTGGAGASAGSGASSSSTSAATGGSSPSASSSGASSGGSGGTGGALGCTGLMGTNLLSNGGIETGVPPWEFFAATLQATNQTVNGGAHALVACKDESVEGESDVFMAYVDVISDGSFGGKTYAASACVRDKPGSSAPTQIHLALREKNGGVEKQYDGASVVPTSSWQSITTSHAMTNSGNQLLVLFVWADSLPDDTCFVVDDAVVVEMP